MPEQASPKPPQAATAADQNQTGAAASHAGPETAPRRNRGYARRHLIVAPAATTIADTTARVTTAAGEESPVWTSKPEGLLGLGLG